MRNFLAFVGAAVVVFLGLGWYLGWYNITPEKAGPGQTRIQVDINKDKIGSDVKKGAEKVEDFIDKNKPADKSGNTDKAENKDKDQPSSGAKLLTPGETKKPSRAEDAFKDFIFDGWGSTGSKK